MPPFDRGRLHQPSIPLPFVPTTCHLGPCYGVLAALDGLAREIGLVQAVGEQTRAQRLARFLIYARLAHQGSRLSAARWSEDHAVKEILQVGSFDEDDLYAALENLEQRQASIEAALAPKGAAPLARAIYLYDVTSVYFEGVENELADFGYNRDGKKGKKQLVAGLLTDGNGEPISIQLYRGNTGDPPTFLDAVQKLKVRFGAQEVALVGDRGMIKRLGKAALGEAKFCYVTALTDPQIRALLAKKRLQLELFEDQPAEVELNGKRYVLRCNPQTQARERARRADQWARVQAKLSARNLEVEHSRLAEGEALRRKDRATQRRLQAARFPVIKTLEQFDWAWPTKINRPHVQNLFRLSFLQDKANIIFMGGAGLGKSHLATALAYEACLAGHTVLFTTAIDIVNTLAAAQSTHRLKIELRKYTSPSIALIDELGYLPIDKTGADLLFQVFSQRYEHGSTIITTNQAYKHWAKIFNNDATLTSAVLDRLLHHAETVTIEGKSYRMKDQIEEP